MHPRLSTAGHQLTMASAVGVLALTLAACGGSTPSAKSTTKPESKSTTTTPGSKSTTTVPGSNTTTTTPGSESTTTTIQSSGSSLTSLGAVLKSLQTGENASFAATYTATLNGRKQTFTFEQAERQSFLRSNQGEVIDTGSATYFCTTSGTISCVSTQKKDPAATLLNLSSPAAISDNILSIQTALAIKVATATFSTATYAGQPSTCVAISGSGRALAKYTTIGTLCVTSTGQVAYISTSARQVIQMTSYSTTVNPSDFLLPSGASVETTADLRPTAGSPADGSGVAWA
jgi:mucin-22